MSRFTCVVRERARDERGFTLIEMLVVMFVGAIVLSITGNAIITTFTSQRRQTAQLQSLNESKISFERLTREVRGANPLILARENEITVEITADGFRHTITYEVADGVLTRTELIRDLSAPAATPAPADRVMVRNVTMPAETPVFRYFTLDEGGVRLELDAPDNDTDPPLDVRQVGLVRIDLRVLPREGRTPIALTDEVRLRNG